MIFNPLDPKYTPYSHWQLSSDHLCDGQYCLSCFLVDALTPLCKFFGDNTNYNPQYIAETSHTTVNGNTVINIDQAFYQYGLVSNTVLPELTEFNWGQLYNRDLTNIIPIGQKFWDIYDPKKTTITAINPAEAVALSQQATTDAPYTIGVIVDLNNGLGSPLYHGQALLMGEIWDSEPPENNPKPSNHKIVWAYKFVIKPKLMNQTQVVKSKDGITLYLCTPIATDWQNFLKQASVEGIDVPAVIPPSSSL